MNPKIIPIIIIPNLYMEVKIKTIAAVDEVDLKYSMFTYISNIKVEIMGINNRGYELNFIVIKKNIILGRIIHNINIKLPKSKQPRFANRIVDEITTLKIKYTYLIVFFILFISPLFDKGTLSN